MIISDKKALFRGVNILTYFFKWNTPYEDIKTIAATNSTNYKELFSEDKHDFSKKVFVESKYPLLFFYPYFLLFATPLWWKTGGQGKRAFRYQTFSIHHSFPSLGILLLILKYFHRGFLASRIIAWFSNSQIYLPISYLGLFHFIQITSKIQYNLRYLELIWLFAPFSPSHSFAAWGVQEFSVCAMNSILKIFWISLFVKTSRIDLSFSVGRLPSPGPPARWGIGFSGQVYNTNYTFLYNIKTGDFNFLQISEE